MDFALVLQAHLNTVVKREGEKHMHIKKSYMHLTVASFTLFITQPGVAERYNLLSASRTDCFFDFNTELRSLKDAAS